MAVTNMRIAVPAQCWNDGRRNPCHSSKKGPERPLSLRMFEGSGECDEVMHMANHVRTLKRLELDIVSGAGRGRCGERSESAGEKGQIHTVFGNVSLRRRARSMIEVVAAEPDGRI